MARLKRNSLFAALQGTIGKEIVFKQYADKVVVSLYPDMSKVKPSELQKLQRNKMKEANAYASAVIRDPKLRAKYEKKLKPGESVFHKAKKEFFEREKIINNR
jgi:long-subunit acyl-CoA synthetase (AMP-forming)